MTEYRIVRLIEKIKTTMRQYDRNYEKSEIAEAKNLLRMAYELHSELIRKGFIDESKLDAIAEMI